MRIFAVFLFALAAFTLAAPARADVQVPNSTLQLRILSRTGEAFVVEVANRSDDVAHFDSVGLYFVPNADEAPQRLGVVTSGEIASSAGHWKDAPPIIEVAPHQTLQVRLAAYCLDQLRASPKETVSYHLATKRMPYDLMIALAGSARTIANTGYDPELRGTSNQMGRHVVITPGLVSSVTQGAIWRIRAAMPTPLQGETQPATPQRSRHEWTNRNTNVEY